MLTRLRDSMRDHRLSWLALIPSALGHRRRGSGVSHHHPGAGETQPQKQAGTESVPFPQQRKRSDERERNIV